MITMTLTHAGTLSFQVGDKCIDDITTGMPSHIYPVFDLYGKCDRLTIFNPDTRTAGSPLNDEMPVHTPSMLTLELNAPQQCEKGNLEMHEKELEPMQFVSDSM